MLTAPRRLDPRTQRFEELVPADGEPPERWADLLAEHGYLWFRGLIPADLCRTARVAIAGRLAALGALDPSRPAEDLPCRDGLPPAPGYQETGDRQPEVAAAVQGDAVRTVITRLLGGAAEPSTYLWTRPVPPGGATGVHIDRVYVGQGSPRFLTIWCCLADTPRRRGGLAVMPGSHTAPALAKVHATYGRSDVDRDLVDGTFDDAPVAFAERYGAGWGVGWASADYGVGDVMVFGMHLVHASLVNTDACFRLTCDARWTPRDEPQDPRWFGPAPLGHHRWKRGAPITPMAAARAAWGV
jgi:hypothetical protein